MPTLHLFSFSVAPSFIEGDLNIFFYLSIKLFAIWVFVHLFFKALSNGIIPDIFNNPSQIFIGPNDGHMQTAATIYQILLFL